MKPTIIQPKLSISLLSKRFSTDKVHREGGKQSRATAWLWSLTSVCSISITLDGFNAFWYAL